MKSIKKIFSLGLMTLAVFSILFTSCQKKPIIPVNDQAPTKEEILSQMEGDEDVIAFAKSMSEVQNAIKNAIADKNISIDELRENFITENEEALEVYFGDTEIKEIFLKAQEKAAILVNRYPSLLEDGKCESCNDLDALKENSDLFNSFYGEADLRGCSFWSWANAKKLLCQAACVTTAGSCGLAVAAATAISGGLAAFLSFVCVLWGLGCTDFCDWYFCR